MITCLMTVAQRVGAHRLVRGSRFHHPIGDPTRAPADEERWRRQVVERALAALQIPVQEPTIFDVQA